MFNLDLKSKEFINEMTDYAKTIIFLINNDKSEVAYAYELSFYARMFGYFDNIKDYNYKIDLNIDSNVSEELTEHLYNGERVESINSDNIYHSYYVGKQAYSKYNKEVLDKLIKLDFKIFSSKRKHQKKLIIKK